MQTVNGEDENKDKEKEYEQLSKNKTWKYLLIRRLIISFLEKSLYLKALSKKNTLKRDSKESKH